MNILIMAFYLLGIADALIDFYEKRKNPELKSRVKSAAKFLLDIGSDLEPKFKELCKRPFRSTKFGLIRGNWHWLEYEHFDVFDLAIRGGKYDGKLAEVRDKLLSVIDPKIDAETKRANAEFCIDFLSAITSTCLHEFDVYEPRVPRGIGRLCKQISERGQK